MHEFGHAAGLLHEHAHPKSTCPYFNEDIEEGIKVKTTTYDEQSIMNYCLIGGEVAGRVGYLPILNEKIFGFSAGDIRVLDSAYK